MATASVSLAELSQKKLPVAILTASLIGLLLSIAGVQLLSALANASHVDLPDGEPQSVLFEVRRHSGDHVRHRRGADGVHQILKRYLGTATDLESLLKPLRS